MNAGACEIGSVPFQNATWLFAALADFHTTYGLIHPYIALLLCLTGTLLNVMTIAVLTRPSMVSPVNALLCAVAICDVLVMTSYLIFVTHFLINAANRCLYTDYSYSWTVFTLIHAHASVILHSTSIWLTVLLAQIRVLTIRRATLHPSTTVTIRFTVVLSIATCFVMSLFNLPNFLTFKIVKTSPELFLPCLLNNQENASSSTLLLSSMSNNDSDDQYQQETENSDYSELDDRYPVYMLVASQGNCMKLKLAFWSNGMLFKVVPCLLLTVSIVALLRVIADLSEQRRTLAQLMRRKIPKDHTTPMLVAVLSIFLIAELPQGVMNVLTGIFTGDTFHQKVYLPVGDFMDLLSLINSAVNFLIYCIMNKRFRITFLELFCGFYINRKLSGAMDDYSHINIDVFDSPRKRSGRTTDVTRTEQFMLASSSHHRPSAVSVLISLSAARDQSMRNAKKFTDNLLAVEGNTSRKMPFLVRGHNAMKKRTLDSDSQPIFSTGAPVTEEQEVFIAVPHQPKSSVMNEDDRVYLNHFTQGKSSASRGGLMRQRLKNVFHIGSIFSTRNDKFNLTGASCPPQRFIPVSRSSNTPEPL